MKTIVRNIVLSNLHVLLIQSSHPPCKIEITVLFIVHTRKWRRRGDAEEMVK